jgi:hypothetical protein
MAELPGDMSETIWRLQRQLANVIDRARYAEFFIFDTFGETEQSIIALDELQSIAEQATDQFSQFSSLQLRIFNVQPTVSNDMLEFVGRIISSVLLVICGVPA